MVHENIMYTDDGQSFLTVGKIGSWLLSDRQLNHLNLESNQTRPRPKSDWEKEQFWNFMYITTPHFVVKYRYCISWLFA